MFQGPRASILNADWMEAACFEILPAPFCRPFNYHRESELFFHFGQPQDWNIDRSRLITLLHLWQEKSSQLDKVLPSFLTSRGLFCPSGSIMVTQVVKVACKQS